MTYVADYFNGITGTERTEVKTAVEGLLDLSGRIARGIADKIPSLLAANRV